MYDQIYSVLDEIEKDFSVERFNSLIEYIDFIEDIYYQEWPFESVAEIEKTEIELNILIEIYIYLIEIYEKNIYKK